jgi:hypothetical protein
VRRLPQYGHPQPIYHCLEVSGSITKLHDVQMIKANGKARGPEGVLRSIPVGVALYGCLVGNTGGDGCNFQSHTLVYESLIWHELKREAEGLRHCKASLPNKWTETNISWPPRKPRISTSRSL